MMIVIMVMLLLMMSGQIDFYKIFQIFKYEIFHYFITKRLHFNTKRYFHKLFILFIVRPSKLSCNMR